jgi:hypothetical protein
MSPRIASAVSRSMVIDLGNGSAEQFRQLAQRYRARSARYRRSSRRRSLDIVDPRNQAPRTDREMLTGFLNLTEHE